MSWLGGVAAVCGYALFWYSLLFFKKNSTRFLLATVWYAAVQAIHLSWMTSISFQGYYILWVYLGLCLGMGLQFGLASLLLPLERSLSWMRVFSIASLLTVFEWSRLFFLCGFSWNPAGLSLAGLTWPIQMASLCGILGVSFWVFLVNLALLKGGRDLKKSSLISWSSLAAFPYLFGFLHVQFHQHQALKGDYPTLSVSLVQTGLAPSEKVPIYGKLKNFIPPDLQWGKILDLLQSSTSQRDLIVLPEAVVPYRADLPIYSALFVEKIFVERFGEEVKARLPPMEAPYARQRYVKGELLWFVSNLYFCQAISNIFNAEVIAGLEAQEGEESYNAAFHLLPEQKKIERYEKQILLPLAEYLPHPFFKKWTSAYGITDFFTHGRGSTVFQGKVPLSISICYEETFSEVLREGRRKGAELFVNVTNDSYYPYSQLPQQHFDHGRVRAIENGIPLIRSCNTGITAAVDSLGRSLSILGEGGKRSEWIQGTLNTTIKIYTYKTVYAFLGDGALIFLCLLLLFVFFRLKNSYDW